jgi:hypothetical protein
MTGEQVERQLEDRIEFCLGIYSRSGVGKGDWRLVSEGESCRWRRGRVE